MMLLPLATLAQAAAATNVDPGAVRSNWAPVVLLILIGIGFAVGNVVASLIIGPSRQGDVKSGTYESGMVPIGDTRRRFNVRFYIVAMIFLVIDVDIIFFYPWATIFSPVIQQSPAYSSLLLLEMILFVAILLVAYFYAWGKGVFRWD
jgi:NADH-quinone oxidoreductase subunit A